MNNTRHMELLHTRLTYGASQFKVLRHAEAHILWVCQSQVHASDVRHYVEEKLSQDLLETN